MKQIKDMTLKECMRIYNNPAVLNSSYYVIVDPLDHNDGVLLKRFKLAMNGNMLIPIGDVFKCKRYDAINVGLKSNDL